MSFKKDDIVFVVKRYNDYSDIYGYESARFVDSFDKDGEIFCNCLLNGYDSPIAFHRLRVFSTYQEANKLAQNL
jgi:hypothetical protein